MLTSQDNLFVKPAPKGHSAALKAEVLGLKELEKFKAQHGLLIPRVFSCSETELRLERIIPASPQKKDWAALGLGLAKLHAVTSDFFGFSSDNFIGPNPQINTRSHNWGEFFFASRLKFQVSLMADLKLGKHYAGKLAATERALIDFLNSHGPKPCLLHGDLWSGNVMFDQRGPWLIDPAVYYGDREADLAMTKMFGGFPLEFYLAYSEARPLPPGADLRETIYNLYHYLNHLNLFGTGYLPAVDSGFLMLEQL